MVYNTRCGYGNLKYEDIPKFIRIEQNRTEQNREQNRTEQNQIESNRIESVSWKESWNFKMSV